jgi:replication factor A1
MSASRPNNAPTGGAADDDTMPISELNPYNSRWVLCARVTNITERSYRNDRGEGKILSLDLLDKSGEIRCTAFNETADMILAIQPPIESGKMIRVRGGKLKPANKKFSRLKNDYEITFDKGTTITHAEDSGDGPTIQYDFCDFSKLEAMDKTNAYVDVLAVITAGDPDVSTIVSKRTGAEIIKREVTVRDRSMIELRCTLWGKEATNFTWTNGDVLLIKGASLSDFNGVSMSIGNSSSFELNPDRQEVHDLREWYENEGKNGTATAMTRGSGGGKPSRRVMCHQVKDENLGMNLQEPDYFTIKGTVTFVRKTDGMIYKACAASACNKKVIEESDTDYRCEKCNQSYPNFKYRAMCSVSVLDSTGQVWISNFADTAEKILGATSQELGELKDQDDELFKKKLEKAYFKKYVFKCRGKADTYNDETRPKINAMDVQLVDPVSESNFLIGEINKYAALSA